MKVSVIIPVYNAADTLKEAIHSVLDQTYRDFEIILVVEVSSTDRSVEIANSYVLVHPEKVRVLLRDDRSLQAAFNAGLAAATGDAILELPADDRLSPLYLEKTVPALTEGVGMVATSFELFGSQIDNLPHVNRINRPDLPTLSTNGLQVTALIRKDVAQRVGGQDPSMIYEDWDFVFKILEDGQHVLFLYETLFFKRMVSSSRSVVTIPKDAEGREQICQRHGHFVPSVPDSQNKKITIVTTTINIPMFLKQYEENARRFGHEGVDFVVVGDQKSDPGTADYCREISNCTYLDLPAQDEYMSRFSKLRDHLPINSIERRNIGMLMAYERGADVVITLDDDNFTTGYDAVGCHSIVGSDVILPTYRSSSLWFNVCSFLKERNDVEFYHRGYPPSQRWHDGSTIVRYKTCEVVVNAGFWLNNPDVDAITRLEREVYVTGYKQPLHSNIALEVGTWSPWDCQNTAIAREVIPAYFLSPYIGRHSDIFASYVVNRIAEHLHHSITFGNPLALHKRSPHSLWKDFDIEREGIQATDSFCRALRGINITANNYHDGLGQVVSGLRPWAVANGKEKIIEGMALWHEVFNAII